MDAALDEIVMMGEARVNKLGAMMLKAGRTDEFIKSLTDRDFQKKLFVKFGFGEETQG